MMSSGSQAAVVGTLGALRDVGGVIGSFVVSRDGTLVGRDMGALFPDDLLAEVAPRVVRLADGPAAENGELRSCVVRFAEHMLYLRAFAGGAVCVLATGDVSLPALKMGASLVARRIEPIVSARPAPPPPPAPTRAAPPPAPIATPVPAPPARSAIQWRGAVLADKPRKP
jgi:predicted regulator of Ras-like GTPase activity (Roadblock/LC7/MglB family)